MQQLLTPAEYARLRGLNRSTVSRQIKTGAIPTTRGKIDPKKADRARAENLDPTRGRRKETPEPEKPKTLITVQAIEGGTAPDLMRARVRKELALARLRELEAAIAEGSLVELKQIESAIESLIVHAREKLLSIPLELGPRLASESRAYMDERALAARLTEMLQAEIRSALNLLAKYQPEKTAVA